MSKKGKNATEMQKKERFVQCMEKVLWPIQHVRSGVWSFVLGISRWTVLHGGVDLLKLGKAQGSNGDITWEQLMLYHLGESWHTQNTHINKVIGENEQMCLLFY